MSGVDGALAVLLEGRVAGRLERSGSGALQLHYEESYRNDPAATPLSVSMPLGQRTHGDAVVKPWLWGLLPDNAEVLARWARDFGVSATSPFPLLGTQVGHDCAGAVQFCAENDVDDLLERDGSVEWLSDAQVGERLARLRVDNTAWLGPGFTGQFSLGGAQAKTALAFDGERWGVPSGNAPTTHIVKPAMAGFEAQDLNEHLCLAAASKAGLRAAASSVVVFGDQSAIAVERFDRRVVSGRLVRIHQEDLGQALSLPPARKYQTDGGPGPQQIVDVLRSVIVGQAAETDVWRFVDALAFNWVIGGTDAHAKNYSLLLAAGQVRLAPLYDIASILPYDDSNGRRIRLAMTIGVDDKLPRVDRRRAWERLAQDLRLDATAVLERAAAVAARLPEAFAAAATDPSVQNLGSTLPNRLAGMVATRAATCSRLLT